MGLYFSKLNQSSTTSARTPATPTCCAGSDCRSENQYLIGQKVYPRHQRASPELGCTISTTSTT